MLLLCLNFLLAVDYFLNQYCYFAIFGQILELGLLCDVLKSGLSVDFLEYVLDLEVEAFSLLFQFLEHVHVLQHVGCLWFT